MLNMYSRIRENRNILIKRMIEHENIGGAFNIELNMSFLVLQVEKQQHIIGFDILWNSIFRCVCKILFAWAGKKYHNCKYRLAFPHGFNFVVQKSTQ